MTNKTRNQKEDWKLYEDIILSHFQEVYPEAEVLAQQTIVGVNSEGSRQIDILITGEIAGFKIKVVIDCKHFSRKVGVKTVESFIGMLADVQASKGVIITNIGYTKGAIKRAKRDSRDIQLDIVDFEDLPQFSGVSDAVISKWNDVERMAAIFSCPFGWIVHETPRTGVPAGLTRRDRTWDEGWAARECIYANFSSKKEFQTLEELFAFQEECSLESFPGVEFDYFESAEYAPENRFAKRVVIRIGYYRQYPETETTVFLDFGTFYVFFVLTTPKTSRDQNLKKLSFIVRTTIPYDLPDRTSELPFEYLKFLFTPPIFD